MISGLRVDGRPRVNDRSVAEYDNEGIERNAVGGRRVPVLGVDVDLATTAGRSARERFHLASGAMCLDGPHHDAQKSDEHLGWGD